jgi:hypothetical protein
VLFRERSQHGNGAHGERVAQPEGKAKSGLPSERNIHLIELEDVLLAGPLACDQTVAVEHISSKIQFRLRMGMLHWRSVGIRSGRRM